MAKVSHDADSWKASGVLRRDARQTKDEPNIKHPGKKNTKRWCKGKVGREHTLVTRPIQMGGNLSWGDEDYCKVCSKVVVQRWKFTWSSYQTRSAPHEILDVCHVKGRGYVAMITLTGAVPVVGVSVYALHSFRNTRWTLAGIEREMIARELQVGDTIGLLLQGTVKPEKGQTIRWALS